MCGLTGFWSTSTPAPNEVGQNMAAVLNHRGPDDAGVWSDENSGVTLAHKRLSILDLSEAGHQPMKSHCGRYVLVFNGEIYNHKSLRVELENAGYTSRWRGYSDTETLVNAISVWGIEGALKKTKWNVCICCMG
jgi:asparagine synthase (glutamine-hydrolysing)